MHERGDEYRQDDCGTCSDDKKTGSPGWTSGNECIRGVRPRRDIEYEAATPEKKRKSIEKIHR